MRVDDFDFDLPESSIALRPLGQAEAARLLCVSGDKTNDRTIADLPDLLRPNDLLVINNTKVIPAFLRASRPPRDVGGSTHCVDIDVTLHKREASNAWRAFAKPAKRLKRGDELHMGEGLIANVGDKTSGGEVHLTFNHTGAILDQKIAAAGLMPLPPYIASKRAIDAQDKTDYQTMFARQEGAVAAPTAGLHFTPDLMDRLERAGIGQAELTLHVGAGTFLPVKVQDTSDHIMHSEWGEITPEVAARINETRQKGGRIIAVGTTVLRLLESATDGAGVVHAFCAETDIFITPGYEFRAVDVLITNFHLPRSTLFMLICAFAGTGPMKTHYAHAIASGYRFYSYGDACLLHRHDLAEKCQ